MVDRMKTAPLEEAQANLSVTTNQAKAYADASRLAETFEVGNEVVLAMRHLHVNEHLPVKLKCRWIGPFSIAKVISPVAYRLDLPPTWRIHLVFHVSNLKRFHRSEESERVERPPSPIVVDGEEEFEVEAILRHKGTSAQRLYQVLWKGCPIPRLVGSLNCISATLLRSWRTTCAASQLWQDVSDGGSVTTGGLIDGVLEDSPGHYSFSGWEQLVVGSHAWREIVFSVPSPCLLPKGCNCTEDCCVKV